MRHPQLFERWELIGLPGLPFPENANGNHCGTAEITSR